MSRDNPKTVAQLIAELQEYPPDTRVMTSGYEGGLCDAGKPEAVDVVLNVNDAWYYGPHEKYNNYDVPKDSPTIRAIVL